MGKRKNTEANLIPEPRRNRKGIAPMANIAWSARYPPTIGEITMASDVTICICDVHRLFSVAKIEQEIGMAISKPAHATPLKMCTGISNHRLAGVIVE